MRQKIENHLFIEVDGVDLNSCSGLEFYVKQDHLFFQYIPEVKSASEMLVTVPYKDAIKLRRTPVQIQFAFTDANGNKVSLTTDTEALPLPPADILSP